MAMRERLHWDETRGVLHDGPRRYLMLRPDVLMGGLVRLDHRSLDAVLGALAASARQHGADSLRAYAAEVDGDDGALISATVGAAADLGWGRWTITRDAATLTLDVAHSPFADGWRMATPDPATAPVCAPIRGMLAGLAEIVFGAPAQVDECHCAAMHGTGCHFIAMVPR